MSYGKGKCFNRFNGYFYFKILGNPSWWHIILIYLYSKKINGSYAPGRNVSVNDLFLVIYRRFNGHKTFYDYFMTTNRSSTETFLPGCVKEYVGKVTSTQYIISILLKISITLKNRMQQTNEWVAGKGMSVAYRNLQKRKIIDLNFESALSILFKNTWNLIISKTKTVGISRFYPKPKYTKNHKNCDSN